MINRYAGASYFLREVISESGSSTFALFLFFALTKLTLVSWFVFVAAVNPLASAPFYAAPFLFASDLLVCASWFFGYLFLRLLVGPSVIAKGVSRIVRVVFYIAAVALSVAGFKTNQIYGTPMDYQHLMSLGNPLTAIGSLSEEADLWVVWLTVVALGGYLCGVRSRTIFVSVGHSKALLSAGLLVAVYVAMSWAVLGGVYTYGLKKNSIMNVAHSWYRGLRVMPMSEGAGLLFAKNEPNALMWELKPEFAEGHDDGLGLSSGVLAESNVLMILLESTPASYVDASTMPNLKRFSEQAINFSNHITSASTSKESVYSIFYSDYLTESLRGHLRDIHGGKISFASLTEATSNNGYETAVFQSGYLAYTDFVHLWQDKGVKNLVGAEEILDAPETPMGWSWGAYESDTVREITKWLTDDRDTARPFFLTYRPVFPHHPYHSPSRSAPFDADTVQGRFRNSLHYADEQIGVLLDRLSQLELEREMLLVVVADHGETVSEKGSGHGLRVSPEEVVVPFFLHHPKLVSKAGDYNQVTSHIDFAPTIASLLGLPAGKGWLGRDLSSTKVPKPKGVILGNHARQVSVFNADNLCVFNKASGVIEIYSMLGGGEKGWASNPRAEGFSKEECATIAHELDEKLVGHHLGRLETQASDE